MISHSFLLFLGLCKAVILPSKNLQTFVSGFNIPKDLKKVKMVDKNWIDVEKVYTIINPGDGPFVHKETNKIFHVFSNCIGVKAKPCEWVAQRWSENENKNVFNGNFDNEETAAHASDTLARELMENGERCHMLNFPDDDTEVYGRNSGYFGVTYKGVHGWRAYRRSESEKNVVYNGSYKDPVTAAHASDTLARKLMRNGEHGHNVMLNFPDDDTEVYNAEVRRNSGYFGVTYRPPARWEAKRWSRHEHQLVSNGCRYKNEETAAHASDTLARKLIANGEQSHKINFPDPE